MEQIDFKGREIESVEYGENEIVVKLKRVEFEPKSGDFLLGETDCDKWIYIFKADKPNLNEHYATICDDGYCGFEQGCYIGGIKSRRIATDSEKQKLLDALAKENLTWNAEKSCVEKLRFRAKKGEPYWYIDDENVVQTSEDFFDIDNTHFSLGNYYQTKEQAQAAFDEIKLVYAKNL
jgi:hypothetical protein